ncbi:MAG TPA: hypothetical protein VGN95_05255 [Pyrinomonadaceae bacterium]|jgi:proteasome lid subunit RPN8/RPN11|nr:hypothetical protein [Pyrinomonadaceae bacterium]
MDYRALADTELETQPFPVVRHDFRIYIAEEAFDRICDNADTTREVGGILVGEVLRDESGPYVHVETMLEALHAEESGTELTLTHATWNHIHEQMDTVYAGKRIIGWYHTHPNFGIFLSDRDRFIQQSFFDLPFQIALVYDPVRREHGIYTWRENKPWRVRQYWIGANEHVWDEPRDVADNAAPKRKAVVKAEPEATTAAASSLPQLVGDLLGNSWVIGAAIIGVLIGFALGSRFGGFTSAPAAQDQTVQEAIASLNTDLLAIIRGTLSDEAFVKSFDEGIARLDRAAENLKPYEATNPDMKAALQSVLEAQDELKRMRQDRQVAHEMIKQIEQVVREDRTPEFIARDLAAQHAALGSIYLELARAAAGEKDNARVKELLKTAAALDPDGRARYEQQLKDFDERGTLTPPSGGSTNQGGSQPSPAPQTQTPSGSPRD